jgi:Fe2+ or Zn2+ uptake regulation protein
MSSAIVTSEETGNKIIQALHESEDEARANAAAYNVLRGCCEGIMAARLLASQRGERIELTTVYRLIESALTQAEIVQSIGGPDTELAHPHPYCTVCNTLWTDEDESYGRCLTCEGIANALSLRDEGI